MCARNWSAWPCADRGALLRPLLTLFEGVTAAARSSQARFYNARHLQLPAPKHAMTHESRLDRLLRQLLWGRRTAALATLQTLPGAETVPFTTPAVSFVPYAIDSTAQVLVLHVSALAAHTRNLRQSPAVSLLITAPEDAAQPVHALQRVAIQGQAVLLAPEAAASARAAYLRHFPEAAPMTALGDFQFVQIIPSAGRHVAGFGAARDLSAEELKALLMS